MKKQKPLLLNGGPINIGAATPAVDRFIEYLRQLPDDELFDAEHICGARAIGYTALRRASKYDERMKTYCELTQGGRSSKRYLYGNARSIVRLRRLIEEQK